jgi:hypothetical protein
MMRKVGDGAELRYDLKSICGWLGAARAHEKDGIFGRNLRRGASERVWTDTV